MTVQDRVTLLMRLLEAHVSGAYGAAIPLYLLLETLHFTCDRVDI